MTEITDRQLEVLSFIEKFRVKNGYAPSVEEMAEELKVESTFSIRKHIKALQAKALLNHVAGQQRNVFATPLGHKILLEHSL